MTAPTPAQDDASAPLNAPALLDRDALAGLARRERFFEALEDSLAGQRCIRLILGKPRRGGGDLHKLSARPLTLRGQACLSLVWHHSTRDITKNPPLAEGLALLRELLGNEFSHGHLFTTTEELQLLISKRGKIGLVRQPVAPVQAAGRDSATEADDTRTPPTDAAPAWSAGGHDRVKRRPLSLAAPFLHDLGITDAQARLVPAMSRKWKQINKFVEVLDHALDRAGLPGTDCPDGQVHVVDFGAGKGYLTFAMHQHLRHTRGWAAQVRGVELREELVALCNAAAQRRQMDGLAFLAGDVRSHVPERLDVMVALHACDTATDFALHTGIRAGARVIVCSPCCHKQIRPQMAEHLPAALKGLLQHGIHLGQQAEMVTDSLRALLLELHGYEAQVFEFIALEHTSKNKMILATRREAAADEPQEMARRAAAQAQMDEIKAFYGVREHSLEALLKAPAAATPPRAPAGSA